MQEHGRLSGRSAVPIAVVLLTLLLAALFGVRASARTLALLLVIVLTAVIAKYPPLGLWALVLAALVVRNEFSTGTDVRLTAAFVLVPALVVVGLIRPIVAREGLRPRRSPTNMALLLFILEGLLALFIGYVLWDPNVPRSNNLVLVQLAQWAIFAASACAFWLTSLLIPDLASLRRLTWLYILVAGCLLALRLLPGTSSFVTAATTLALFWPASIMLLAALVGGQLLYNHEIPRWASLLLAALLAIVVFYGFILRRDDASVWISIAGALGVLVWSRFPKARWLTLVGLVALIATGLFLPFVYSYAGGDQEWMTSGGSRLILIQRVIEVTMRNPITGLGPAAYRSYAAMSPLAYEGAYWARPAVNSHNNYVDLFAHVGLLGLTLFGVFACALGRTALRLRRRYTVGFVAAFVNALLAAGVGSLILMALADWMLPHVYNIGFTGFQASVLVWLFLGGLPAIEAINPPDGAALPAAAQDEH